MKRAIYVARAPRVEEAKSGLFLFNRNEHKKTVAHPHGTMSQHKQHEAEENAAPRFLASHSAASMRALSAAVSTHGFGVLFDRLSFASVTVGSSLTR